jgi:hypothetical protein
MTVLGVKTPEGGNPPPLSGTRFGDPSTFQRPDIPGGFHCRWDVWENTGAPVLAPLPGIVIESRGRNTVSEDFYCLVVELLDCVRELLPWGSPTERCRLSTELLEKGLIQTNFREFTFHNVRE